MIDPLVDVTVYDGKYRYVQEADGSSRVYRYGKPWNREVTGDGFVLALAQEVAELRARLSLLSSIGTLSDVARLVDPRAWELSSTGKRLPHWPVRQARALATARAILAALSKEETTNARK